MDTQNQNSKFIWPTVLIFILVILYFLYNLFSDSGLSANPNNILKNTKLGTSIELINKENISFNQNAVNYFNNNLKDFSKIITPSPSRGRENPFVP